jgi:hypothetical protein
MRINIATKAIAINATDSDLSLARSKSLFVVGKLNTKTKYVVGTINRQMNQTQAVLSFGSIKHL